MTDRELLERAAGAAGIILLAWNDGTEPYSSGPGFIRMSGKIWNPLEDDGDALRLAVKLHLDIVHNEPQDNDEWVMVSSLDVVEDVDGEFGRIDATRRAIVRAAAAIGEKGK